MYVCMYVCMHVCIYREIGHAKAFQVVIFIGLTKKILKSRARSHLSHGCMHADGAEALQEYAVKRIPIPEGAKPNFEIRVRSIWYLYMGC